MNGSIVLALVNVISIALSISELTFPTALSGFLVKKSFTTLESPTPSCYSIYINENTKTVNSWIHYNVTNRKRGSLNLIMGTRKNLHEHNVLIVD